MECPARFSGRRYPALLAIRRPATAARRLRGGLPLDASESLNKSILDLPEHADQPRLERGGTPKAAFAKRG